jgi:predicted DNA-binding transcriptional regulator YafY
VESRALDPGQEFTDPEVARIRAALQTWDSYGANADRRWLEQLLESLFSAPSQT